VEILMEPKGGINDAPLRNLYGAYIKQAFEPMGESRFWIVHQRRQHKVLSGLRP
jgi:hypothetical protein